jgi:Uma2 family endonuclease
VTAPAHATEYSVQDYLALEVASNVKHEFWGGQIFGMAGATPEHAALKAAITGLLFAQIRVYAQTTGTCRAHGSGLRVRVVETGLITYPDITVVCGPSIRDEQDKDALVNPTLIVEVLSPSTEAYDRGDKFEHYKRIPALQQYVLVSHRARELEVWTRGANADWTHAVARAGQTARLDAIGSTLNVDEVYDAIAEPHA